MLTESERGIGNLVRTAISSHSTSKPLHFYSSSGGNAGLACVTAASALGYPSTVVVPLSTKPMMIAKIRTAGATDVIQVGEHWTEADRYLREEIIAKDPNGVYVPPFDHPDVFEGNAKMIDEIAEQMEHTRPDAIICSVGGGGLFCGIMKGLERASWGDVDVLAVETRGADSLHTSLCQSSLATLPAITSIATSLGAVRVSETAFSYAQRSNVKSVVLSDAEAAMGCWRFADDERMIVEAACGVSLALCYDGKLKKLLPSLSKDSRVVVVVCGGSNATLAMLEEYKKTYGQAEGQATSDQAVPSTWSAPRCDQVINGIVQSRT